MSRARQRDAGGGGPGRRAGEAPKSDGTPRAARAAPASGTELLLHRSLGNRRVHGSRAPQLVQRKCRECTEEEDAQVQRKSTSRGGGGAGGESAVVQRRCRECEAEEAAGSLVPPSGAQARLVVGPADDAFEREADRVSEQVVGASGPPLSRVQAKSASSPPARASRSGDSAGDSAVGSLGGGQTLPEAPRSFFESRMGHDFGDVRVHTGSAAAASAESINARAYTLDRDIVFGRSQYDPGSTAGRRLLAHELTHVMQQGSPGAPRLIRRSPKVETVSDCNPAGFTPRNTTGAITNPAGEVAYTVNGIPTKAEPAGTPGRDHENKIIKLYPEDGEIELGQVGFKYWTAVCLQIPQRELSEVHWIRSSYVSAGAAKTTAAAPAADEKAWSGRFSELDGKSDDAIAAVMRTLLTPELVRVHAEAEARSAGKVRAQAAVVLDERLADSSAASEVYAFRSAVAQGDVSSAVDVLARLSSEGEVQMLVAQVDVATREMLRGAAARAAGSSSGAAAVLRALEDFELLVNDVTRFVASETHLKAYRDSFGKDWRRAAEALDHFSDEAIFFELREVGDNDHLRALRKAADLDGYEQVSLIVSAILAAQDKAGVYLQSLGELAFLGATSRIPGAAQMAELSGLIDFRWSEDFVRGLIDGGLDTTLGDAWANMKTELSSPGNVALFVAGYYPGVWKGIALDLWNNIEGLAVILAKIAEYNVRMYYEPFAVLSEVSAVVQALGKALLSTLDAREFGYTASRLLGGKIQTGFVEQTPFFKGMAVGEIVGIVVTEIALLFIGVGEATAALKAVRGTRLVIQVEKALAGSATLQKIMKRVPGSKALSALKGKLGVGRAGELLRGADAAADLRKADDVLIELGKLEKAGDGALISKQMEPLEYAVLAEKVKNPANVRLPKKPFHTKYTMEVKVGDHTYRRHVDGTWCRFSLTSCGHVIEDGLPHGMSIRQREVLPWDIGNGKRQTQRGNLRRRMKNAFHGFQLPSWVKFKPTNWNAHHIIPWEFMNHGVFNVLRNRGLVWDHNAMRNAIALPTKKGIVGAENLPIHQAKKPGVRGHPNYNRDVRSRLDDLLEKHELDPPTLQREVDNLLAELRGDIESGAWAGVPQF